MRVSAALWLALATIGCNASQSARIIDMAGAYDLLPHDQSMGDQLASDLSVADLEPVDQSVPPEDFAAFDLRGDQLRGDANGNDGGLPPDVRGVYIVTSPQSDVDGGTTMPALLTKGVDGILINTAWNLIESNSGAFDFTEFDNEAALAAAANKKIELAIKTGGSEPTSRAPMRRVKRPRKSPTC